MINPLSLTITFCLSYVCIPCLLPRMDEWRASLLDKGLKVNVGKGTYIRICKQYNG